MQRPANINFLTEDENQCFELLLQAQDLFDKICDETASSPTDAYNFGHYLDAARYAILVHGVRRFDPDNLLTRSRIAQTLLDRDKETGSQDRNVVMDAIGRNSTMPSTDPASPTGDAAAIRQFHVLGTESPDILIGGQAADTKEIIRTLEEGLNLIGNLGGVT